MIEMSNEKKETIEDIVREMRNLGRLDEKSTDKIPRTLQALGLRTYADRIEGAAKREVAELRIGIEELLDALQSIYDEECTDYGTGEVYNKWRKALKGAR